MALALPQQVSSVHMKHPSKESIRRSPRGERFPQAPQAQAPQAPPRDWGRPNTASLAHM